LSMKNVKSATPFALSLSKGEAFTRGAWFDKLTTIGVER
jgi:hypothetical protein